MLASRLLPEQVDQEAAWKAAMPGGLQQLVTEPRLCLEYANNLVRRTDRVLLPSDVGEWGPASKPDLQACWRQ